MDPDSGSKSNYKEVFVDCSTKKPEIKFEERLGVKHFDTASMIDDTESIVLSSAAFDGEYNFLHGEVCVMRLGHDEFYSVKRSLGNEVSLMELIDYRLSPIEAIMLTTGPNGRKYETLIGDEVVDTSYRDIDFYNSAIEDRQLSSTIDYMNNYLIRYGTCHGLSANSFRTFEEMTRSIDTDNIEETVQPIDPDNVMTFEQAQAKVKVLDAIA